MTSSLQQRALLPAGFHDVLPPDAHARAGIVSTLLEVFTHYGYELVMPPTVEFEESLFTGSGKALEAETFRLMDPGSQKMMGLRPDITMQVARIAATRLANGPVPLRLSYSGQVFRVKGVGVHAERQTTQAGVELVGVDSKEADAEVVQVAIDALERLGLSGLSIDFNLPQLANILLKNLTLDENAKNLLKQALSKKDTAAIVALAGAEAGNTLAGMVTPHSNGVDAAAYLLRLPLPHEAMALCQRLQEVVTLVKKAAPEVSITIDPLEHRGFEYHTGIGFAFFCKQHMGEIGRGGRYVIAGGKEAETTGAVGATLYINDIYRLVPSRGPKPKIYIPSPVPAQEIRALQAQGFVTLHATGLGSDAAAEAKRLHCVAVYRDGGVEKLTET